LTRGRYWLVLGAAMWAAAVAGPPPPPPGTDRSASADVPDDELIEFLGADDHGDAAWWEFLKNAQPGTDKPGADKPGAPPPQDPKR
jgi:hypothetical protein